jgi:hypothetical protein
MKTHSNSSIVQESMTSYQKLLSFLLAIFAFAAVKSFLDNDSGKLISDLGTDVLKDKKTMSMINSKIDSANTEANSVENSSSIQIQDEEVLIDLDKVA